MSLRPEKNYDHIVKNLIKNNRKEIAKQKCFEDFINLFFSKVVQEDLLLKSDEYLLSLVDSAFQFFKKKNLKESKIRIYTPDAKHVLTNQHTIIELVNNDKPFIVDSITAEIVRMGYNIERVINHVVATKRDSLGKLKTIEKKADEDPKIKYESIIQYQVSQISSTAARDKLKKNLHEVIKLVRASVNDWKDVLDQLNQVRNELRVLDIKLHNNNLTEHIAFIDWVEDRSFIFLGATEFKLEQKSGKINFKAKNKSKLGIAKIADFDDLKTIPLEVWNKDNHAEELIEITKCRSKSRVHRPVHIDNIRIKKLDNAGNVIGEYRFYGLFTSVVFYQNAANIPILRTKIDEVISRSGYDLTGHNGKELTSILAAYPREELFQITANELYKISLGIIGLSGRLITKIFIRKDKFSRFISVLCFIPKHNFSTGVREKVQHLLENEFNGEVTAHYTLVGDSALARVHYILDLRDGLKSKIDYHRIEADITNIASVWLDKLHKELKQNYDEETANLIHRQSQNAFSLSYTEAFSTTDALEDIKVFAKLAKQDDPIIKLNNFSAGSSALQLKIYSLEQQIILSEIMPILENFGLIVRDEHTYKINYAEQQNIFVHNFAVEITSLERKDYAICKLIFEEALQKAWLGEIENDALNKLVLSAQINARDVSLIRSYARYLKQTNFSYSFSFVAEVLFRNSQIANDFIELFYAKFLENNATKTKEKEAKIKKTLKAIANLAEDSVVRKLIELFEATVRTNFFQRDKNNEFKDYISLKLHSKNIEDIPLPKPFAEIFVYSPTMEAVHLRAGKVARGGLRWSDRTEDFRTEVHGLVKAQITKNAVIVPTGSKGGFVVKKDLSKLDRDSFIAEGVKAYQTFLSGLLDITDNIVADKIVPPAKVVRYDEDDPYLVVAADKGTATFSDIANEISAQYNFWLGDAFASGGSNGYDHKKMGITAKGAWVSVTRHLHEIGIDIAKQEFSAVAVGDMAGDVFGNGMLLSDNIKLIAAFNHLHIFIDPNPDSKKSYKERQRLFNLPRSSWTDYNADLISNGGGIYERSAKTITISKKAADAFGITELTLTPNELIKAILCAPVDVLWNGGIGTYVKSSQENHTEVGDRANDSVRIDATELRTKVVGEGGNLGLTQRGRIEYALKGGKINTDAMDNSAGVDCSDHEVNIKIALQSAITGKKLSMAKRNKLLEDMTERVEYLVLRDNFLQTQAISIAESHGVKALEQQERLMKDLERIGLLDRKVEFLPDSDEVANRHSQNLGLTRPELCVLLAYSKLYFYENILNSDIPDDEYYYNELIRYFPEQLNKNFAKEVRNHNLKREIIATYVTNSLVNRLGITFFHRLTEDTGLKMCDIARAYTITRDSFAVRKLWKSIQDLGSSIPAKVQIAMFRDITILTERTTAWFCRNLEQPVTDVAPIIAEFSGKIEQVYKNLENVLTTETRKIFNEKIDFYISKKVPEDIARRVASMDIMSTVCQIVQISRVTKADVEDVAAIYFMVGVKLHLRYLRNLAGKLKIETYWEKLSLKSYIAHLFDEQMRITQEIVLFATKSKKKSFSPDRAMAEWLEKNAKQILRFDNLIHDIQAHDYPDFPMLNVAGNRIREVAAR